MILVLSKAVLEESTNDVIDWLDHYDANYIRLNGDELHNQDYSLDIDTLKNTNNILLGGYQIDLKAINAVWYRRGFWSNPYKKTETNLNPIDVELFMRPEVVAFNKSFYSLLYSNDSFWLSDAPYKRQLNKIDVLRAAAELKIAIPQTRISNRKDQILAFYKQHGPLITKPLYNVSMFDINNTYYTTYTSLLTANEINELPNEFFPSLVQQAIEKDYEVRIFYLIDKLYSMAMFTQADSKTSVDFRMYNYAKPNRCVPYELPKKLETKLLLLMKTLRLNTGSIDLIKGKDGLYYFLEVNPVGQFGMVSDNCNYNAAQLIAKTLIDEDRRRQ